MSPSFLSHADSAILIALCKQGKLYEIETWIAANKSIKVALGSKFTPLQVALSLGFHSLVKLLLSQETDQHTKDSSLQKAVEMRRLDLVELLVSCGSNPLSIPLAHVLCEWNPAIIRFFLEKGADVVSGAPFAAAFKYKIRTAIGPFLEAKRAHPELALDLQKQLDQALRYFCREGNLKWVSLLTWAGANPRSKGLSLQEWDDENDSDSFTSALEEACSVGQMSILKRLEINPLQDDLPKLLKCAGGSGEVSVIKYLLEMGSNPNDKSNGGSQALDQCLFRMGIETWRYCSQRSLVQKWELTSHFDCLQLLIKHGARWEPNDNVAINELRRHLFRCTPEVTIELVKILKFGNACLEATILRLVSTPKMKSHIKSQEAQLISLGLKCLNGNSAKPTDNNLNVESRIPYGLLRKYSRETLYEEAWKQPIKVLCLKYGISDVALAKVCKKLRVPLPGRGYWAKKNAGQNVKRRPELPPINA